MTRRPVLAIAQCGAPTAALNASPDGALRAAAGKFDVLGVVAGPAGLAAGALQRLDPKALPTGLPRQSGAWLGAGRHPWDQASLAAAAWHPAQPPGDSPGAHQGRRGARDCPTCYCRIGIPPGPDPRPRRRYRRLPPLDRATRRFRQRTPH